MISFEVERKHVCFFPSHPTNLRKAYMPETLMGSGVTYSSEGSPGLQCPFISARKRRSISKQIRK